MFNFPFAMNNINANQNQAIRRILFHAGFNLYQIKTLTKKQSWDCPISNSQELKSHTLWIISMDLITVRKISFFRDIQ